MTTDPVEILLVEDNPEDVELTLHALGKHNLTNRVIVARDGAEALDILFPGGEPASNGSVPRLVLLDLKLPKLSGLEVLARMRAADELSRVPIVVLTSSKEDKDIEEAYRLGANSYIVKPVEFDSFVKSVQDVGLYWMVLNQPPSH